MTKIISIGEFSDFGEFTLYLIFANFLKMAIPKMLISWNFENHIKADASKEFVIIFVIFPQKWRFELKNKNFQISRNSA